MGSLGGSLGCLKGSLGTPLGHSGGPVGIPGVLLVALEEVFSFLGRPEDGFRENPGNSGSQFGSIFDDFSIIVHDIFRLRFLDDFLIDFGGILQEFLYFLRSRENTKISTSCRRELKNQGSGGSQMILKCVEIGRQIQCKQYLSF